MGWRCGRRRPRSGNNLAIVMNWISRHRRSLLFLMLLPVLAGIAAVSSLPVTLFPNVSFPRVRLTLDAGDRPAEQMTLLVTVPVEQAVHKVPHVVDVRSTTSRGTAEVIIAFDWGTDMVAAGLQIEAAVAQVLPQLPQGTTMLTRRMDPTVFPIISYSLTSETLSLTTIRDLALFQIRPLLTSIPGVASIGVIGGSDQEYQVLIDPNRLTAAGLTIDDVAKSVTANNLLQAVGRLQDHYKLFLVIADQTVAGVNELRQIAIRAGPEGVTRLADVATVQLATVPLWTRVSAAGQDAILFNIYQQPGGNSVSIAKEVKSRLEAYRSKLPAGVTIANWYDQSELVTAAAISVRDAIIIGTVLASLVLLLFLGSLKVTLIAILVVPSALAATVMLLFALQMSFNIMTLGGLAAAVGLIIDDAIVMVEHIIRRVRGQSSANACQLGVFAAAAEFTRPLTGSSSATVVIFLPLALLSGVTGAFFKALSLTMAGSLIFSFIITWLAVPIAARWLLTPKDAARQDVGPVARRIRAGYGAVAKRLLRHPALVVLGAIAPLLAIGWLAWSNLGSGFMPAMDEGGFIVDYRSAPGTSLDETDRLVRQVESILKTLPEVATWSRRTGLGLGGDLSEANQGDFFVRLNGGSRRPIDEVMADLRSRIAQEVPGLSIEMAQLMEDLIGDLTGVPQPIEIKLLSDDPKLLLSTAQKVADAVGKIKGVVFVRNGINPAGDALQVTIDRVKAAAEGIDPAEATRLTETFLSGRVVTYVPQTLKQVGVRIWTVPDVRKTELDLGNLPIRAVDGHLLALKYVANIVPVTGQPQIVRENLQRMVAVTGRLEGIDLGTAAAEVQHLLTQPGLLPKAIRYELGGLYLQQQIAFSGLIKVFAAAAASVFVLLLFLYERFAVALAILLMPLLATCAVFVGLWLTKIELNITAMMGMTMIIGIVTEVAIFFFSEFEELRAGGVKTQQALVEAGQNRFRPIAMTTLAAILTLLPLALAIGVGSAMQQPLAIAIISGLLVQLPLVLFVMPSVFLLINRAFARMSPARESE
jgi:multidrug efflux pump subunit AcrB